MLWILIGNITILPIVYAQPKISKENIPAGIPSDVRDQILGLYSANQLEIKNSADQLGNMGPHAAASIPFLISILGKFKVHESASSPGANVATALVKLGKLAIESLSTALSDEDEVVRWWAVMILEEIGKPAIEPLIVALNNKNTDVRHNAKWALMQITGQDFGENQTKWQEWWAQNKVKLTDD